MVEQVLVEFSLCFSFDDNHLKNWKSVNSELEKEVHFQFGSFGFGPVGVVLINFWTLSTSANNWWEPILFPEEEVCHDGCKEVKAWIVAQFEDIGCFSVPVFSLISLVNDLINFVFHESVVAILGDLR